MFNGARTSGPPPKYRVPNPDFQPDEADPAIEAFLQRARRALLDAFDALAAAPPPRRPNLSDAEGAALARLPQRGFIIKPADKNLGLTVMRAADYSAALLTHVEDPAVYREVPAATLPRVLGAAARRLTDLVERAKLSLAIDGGLAKFLLADADALSPPFLYGLPKVAKMATPLQRPIPLRPIAATHTFLTTRASVLLADELNALLGFFPSILTERDSLARELATLRVPRDAWLVTFDVTALYPSLDHQGCMTACEFALRRYSDATGRRIRFLLSLLEFVLSTSYVTVGDRHFRQIRGGAMGTNCMPPVAQLFMAVLFELPLLARLGSRFPRLYWRYIDDGFMVLSCTRTQLLSLQRLMGQALPNIKLEFTQSRASVNFLDLVISKRLADTVLDPTALVRLETRTHQKAHNRYLYIPYHSFHSTSMLLSFIHGELMRYAATNSSECWFNSMRERFSQRLQARGYPPALLATAFARVNYASARAAFLAGGPTPARPATGVAPLPPPAPVGGPGPHAAPAGGGLGPPAPAAAPAHHRATAHTVLALPYKRWVPELRPQRLLHNAYTAGGADLQTVLPQRPITAFVRTENLASRLTRARHFE
jgi:hypothetical protein